MRRLSLLLGGIAALFSISALPTIASAGDWGVGCGACGYGFGQVFQAAPTYSYAPPTVTIVPQYIVQPNYIVRQTYVLRPTQYVDQTPCFIGCASGYVVNQGQYQTSEYYSSPVIRGYGPRHYRPRYGYGRPHYSYRSYRYRSHYRRW
jgi:hypothetical protein